MTSHKSIMAWGDYGPESVTGRWSANTYDADDAVEYVLKSDFEKVRFAADLGLKMAEVNDLWNTAETIKAALTQTTDKEPAQPDPVGWVCAIEQAVAVADAKRQKYATAAHEKPDPWAQNAAKSLCADDISVAIRALITPAQHDALAAHVAAEVAKARAEDAGLLDASDEVKAYLDGVIGVVEANSFESMCLWMQAKESARSWISTGHGYGPMIGRINNRPVCLSILTANVDGNKIVFIDATSEVSDWKLIDAWLQKNLPQSAMHEDGRINKTDAMNFENVFPRAQIGAKP